MAWYRSATKARRKAGRYRRCWHVLLDEVDRELERRGHCFVRYADDCNVYVRSQKAGERVMAGLRKVYQRLRLKINEGKSAVASAFGRKFLGYMLWRAPGGEVRRAVAAKALEALKRRLCGITKRNRGRSMDQVVEELRCYLPGWKSYFRLVPAGANATGTSRA